MPDYSNGNLPDFGKVYLCKENSANSYNLNCNLPPDPGAAGKQTLQGIDRDGDGVRDDIQRAIVTYYKSNPAIIKLAAQYAKAMQSTLIQGANQTQPVADARYKALLCINIFDSNQLDDITSLVDFNLVNTLTRQTAYTAYREGTHVKPSTAVSDSLTCN